MNEDVTLFQEIDEALRVDNFEKFLRNYGKYVIAGCIGIVLATAFSVFWKGHIKENNTKDTAILISAQELAQSGKYSEAEEKFKEAEKSTYGIAVLAKLQRAKMLVAQGKATDAQALYKEIANYTGSGSDEGLRNFAALNAAILAANMNSTGGEQKPATGHPFDALQQELYALELKKEGKNEEARKTLDNLASSPELLTTERKRAAELRDGLGGKSQ